MPQRMPQTSPAAAAAPAPRTAPDDAIAAAPDQGTGTELMTVAAARALSGGRACFVGSGLPSAAANLASRLHAPNLMLIYESGTIGSRPDAPPLATGDGVPAESALSVVSVPELFNYWVQPGRIDVGLLSGDQIDRFGNINTTVLGSYREPAARLPGSGGGPEVAGSCRQVIVVMRHRRRAFVEQVDFVSAFGRGSGPRDRALIGLRNAGPTRVITDLGVLEPDPETAELVLTALHPGVTVEQAQAETGWALQAVADIATTAAPTSAELSALRGLWTVAP